jgi:hypothetical protein
LSLVSYNHHCQKPVFYLYLSSYFDQRLLIHHKDFNPLAIEAAVQICKEKDYVEALVMNYYFSDEDFVKAKLKVANNK